MSWVCRACSRALVPLGPSRPVLPRRSFHTSSNLALLLKNYMIPTIRVEQDVQSVAKSLQKKVGLAPLFYQNAPVVLDFEPSEGALESNKIVTLFNEIYKLNLIPVGITYSNDPIIQDLAKQYNIPFINSNRPTSARTFPKEESSHVHSHSPLPPSSHPSSPNSLNSPQKPEKMLIRSFSNSIQAEAAKNPAPPPFYTPHDPTGTPPSPSIQLATSTGPPPTLYPPFGSSPSTGASQTPSHTTAHGYTTRTTSQVPQAPSQAPFQASQPPSHATSPYAASSPVPPTQAPHPTVNIESPNNEGIPPLIIKSSLRSGQQVYARNGADLIVMGSVHSGAEALADGNIHIYGSLKGRALAGVSGNMDAKIFSGKFHAELISIADTYCACEEQPPGTDPNKPSVVWLEQGNLKFSTMD